MERMERRAIGWCTRVVGWLLTLGGVIVIGAGGRLLGNPLFSTSEKMGWVFGGSALLALGVYVGWFGRKMCQPTAAERMRSDRAGSLAVLRKATHRRRRRNLTGRRTNEQNRAGGPGNDLLGDASQ